MRLVIVWVCAVVLMATGAVLGADFLVTDQNLLRPFVGFGANISPYVYCAPNWPTEVNKTNVADFERKVLDLRPQHVRIFIQPMWWEKPAEADKAHSVERLCHLMDHCGATVNLTLWGGKYEPNDMGRRMAALFARLIRDEKLTCIRYATLQNEPNGFNMNKDRYVALYRAFDAELRRLGVRDQLEIIGGDLLSTNQEAWFTRLAADLPDVLDGYSVHAYSDYWDTAHMYQRISDIPPIVASLPEAGRKPLYLMEFGVRGHREPKQEPGNYSDGRPMYELPLTANLLAYHVIEAVNRGYLATCQWDMVDVMYDRSHMHYGVIGEPKDGFPLKPAYHLLRLFTHAAGSGWSAVKVAGAADMRSVAAMKSTDGNWTVFALNRSDKELPLSLSGLPPKTSFHTQTWNGDGRGQVTAGSTVTSVADGSLETTLPPMSVIALTTAD